jgi:hypothetical protein
MLLLCFEFVLYLSHSRWYQPFFYEGLAVQEQRPGLGMEAPRQKAGSQDCTTSRRLARKHFMYQESFLIWGVGEKGKDSFEGKKSQLGESSRFEDSKSVSYKCYSEQNNIKIALLL